MTANLHDFFCNVSAKYADNIAIIAKSRKLTYSDLDALANQVANQMQAAGVGSHDVVALLLQDQVIQVAAIIAVLKLNATYLPVHHDTPIDRVDQMIDIAGCESMLTDCDFTSTSHIKVLRSAECVSYATEFTIETHSQKAPAYIIFTSGSTGKPKGVLMAHAGPVNTVSAMDDFFPLTEDDAIIQNASFSFDPSVWLIFWPLAHGAKIILPDNATDVEMLCDVVNQYQIKVLHVGPALFSGLIQYKRFATLNSLRLIIGGGQAWQLNQLQMLSRTLPHCGFCNVYGPTEASIHATAWRITAQQLLHVEHVSIGKPIQHMRAHVLNEQLAPLSPGEVGELYLSGVGLAEGYINQPTLTDAVFITSCEYGRLYKTGDLAAVAPDGNIQFIGRVDDQVQVRGYRVELSEVRTVLNAIPEIKEGVVVVDNAEPENVKLRAFVLSNADNDLAGIMKNHFQDKLPAYMCPSSITIVDKFPLTENAKLDNKALLKQVEHPLSEGVAQVSCTEQVIKDIWQKVLKKSADENENFFEAGGDSLDALKLIAHVNSELSVSLSVMDIFEHPSLSLLLSYIHTTQDVNRSPDLVSTRSHGESDIPLSDNQQWLLAMAKDSKTINNIVLPLNTRGEINPDTLQNAILKLVHHHEILRANVSEVGSNQIRIRQEAGEIYFVEDLSMLSSEEKDQQLDRHYDALNNKSLNICNEPLFTVHLFSLGSGQFRMMIFMHHIISDPDSVRIILQDLHDFYRQPDLSIENASVVRFRDFVQKEQEVHKLAEYIENKNKAVARLTLKSKWVHYGEANANGRQAGFSQTTMPAALASLVNNYAREHEETVFVIFLAAFAKTLRWIYAQNSFAIGVNVSRRNLDAYSRMIGPLSEQAVIDFEQSHWASDLLLKNNIKTHLQSFFSDNSPSLWQIYKTLHERHAIESGDEMFNTLFDYQPMVHQDESAEVLFEPLAVKPSNEIRRHLTMRIAKTKVGFDFQVRYRTSLFTQGDINNIVNNMLTLLGELSPVQLVKSAPLEEI